MPVLIQIEQHSTHLRTHHNNTICISQPMHAYLFCSHRTVTSAQILSALHFLQHTHLPTLSTFRFLRGRKDQEPRGSLSLPSLQRSGGTVRGSSRSKMGFLSHSCFFESIAFFPHSKTSLVQMKSLLGLSAPLLYLSRCNLPSSYLLWASHSSRDHRNSELRRLCE